MLCACLSFLILKIQKKMSTDIFTEVGTVMVFLFAGMGIATFTLWVINKFLTYLFKTLKLWKILIDFIFEYKQFKQWKNEND